MSACAPYKPVHVRGTLQLILLNITLFLCVTWSFTVRERGTFFTLPRTCTGLYGDGNNNNQMAGKRTSACRPKRLTAPSGLCQRGAPRPPQVRRTNQHDQQPLPSHPWALQRARAWWNRRKATMEVCRRREGR